MAKGRRGNGDGTIYYDEKKQRWVGQIMLGYKADGKPDRRTAYGKTRREVAEKLDVLKSDHRSGKLPRSHAETVGSYIKRWLEYRENLGGRDGKGLRKNTRANYRNVWEKHIEPEIGHVRLKDLSPAHLRLLYEAIVKKLREQGHEGIRTAEIAHRFLHVALKAAQRERLITENPCDLLEDKPRTAYDDREVLTMDQARAALEAVQGTDYYPAFLLAMMAGMRRNEILGLRWQDIDLLNGTVTVDHQIQFHKGGTWTLEPVKTKSSNRRAPIPLEAVEALSELKTSRNASDGEFICRRSGREDGRPVRPDDLDHTWADVREKLNLPAGVVLHDLRHSYVTWQAEAGANVKAVAKIVGHADESTTFRIYQKVTAKMERDAAETVRGLLRPAPKPVE